MSPKRINVLLILIQFLLWVVYYVKFPQVLDVSWEMYEDIKLLMGNGHPFGDQ